MVVAGTVFEIAGYRQWFAGDTCQVLDEGCLVCKIKDVGTEHLLVFLRRC